MTAVISEENRILNRAEVRDDELDAWAQGGCKENGD